MVDRMRRLPTLAVDADDVTAAIAGCRAWQLSCWDSVILASAQRAGCDRVLSEDLADGAIDGGVRVESPFVEHLRVSEAAATLVRSGRSWDDVALAAEREQSERACREAGMRPNASHACWDFARRFLDWRAGRYRPRGAGGGPGRPVPDGPASIGELEQQAARYAVALAGAGRRQLTVDTYVRHASFFVRLAPRRLPARPLGAARAAVRPAWQPARR